jgi:hypothetical protein
MLAISRCVNGSVGPIVAEQCFSSALTAIADTQIAVIDAARRAADNNGARLTAAISRAPKAGSTIEIASDSIASDATAPPNRQTTFS